MCGGGGDDSIGERAEESWEEQSTCRPITSAVNYFIYYLPQVMLCRFVALKSYKFNIHVETATSQEEASLNDVEWR